MLKSVKKSPTTKKLVITGTKSMKKIMILISAQYESYIPNEIAIGALFRFE